MSRAIGDKTLYLLSVFCVILLFLPKINIISFENETAGLRIDDFILLFFSFILGFAFLYNEKTINKIEYWLIYIVSLSIISFIINHLLVIYGVIHVKAKLYYAIRICEYFLFFYIGRMAKSYLSLTKIIKDIKTSYCMIASDIIEQLPSAFAGLLA
jgi:CDP-diglyceride synthetase